MEELRRERAQAFKAPREPDGNAASGRGPLRTGDGKQRPDNERWPLLSSNRRYGSGR